MKKRFLIKTEISFILTKKTGTYLTLMETEVVLTVRTARIAHIALDAKTVMDVLTASTVWIAKSAAPVMDA